MTQIQTAAQQAELDASVVVVGAGQAGLSVSHQLTSLGVDHVVLARHRSRHDAIQ
ncbi:MAG: FAD-dependent monooxygenase [Actinomycetota bacterium]|nr:FAD-dependent monooxygenase [Actinomycetota bacterium]MDQ3901797.1 FAD-dependent monooxygenase [Actinomycetota bacterium]